MNIFAVYILKYVDKYIDTVKFKVGLSVFMYSLSFPPLRIYCPQDKLDSLWLSQLLKCNDMSLEIFSISIF